MKGTLLEERGLTQDDLQAILRSRAGVQFLTSLIKYPLEDAVVYFLDSNKCPPLPPPSDAERRDTGKGPFLNETWQQWRPPWSRGGIRRKEIRRKTKEYWRTRRRARNFDRHFPRLPPPLLAILPPDRSYPPPIHALSYHTDTEKFGPNMRRGDDAKLDNLMRQTRNTKEYKAAKGTASSVRVPYTTLKND